MAARRVLLQKHVLISSAILLSQLVYAAVHTREPPLSTEATHTGDPNHLLPELTPIGLHSGHHVDENCSQAAVEQFPRPIIGMQQRRQGAIVIHIVIAIYMFASLSILCEDYFVPSIEVLTESLEIDPDVAGATFMAAASSVPAIAASIIAIIVAKGDLGVSTALGSAVLNGAGVVSVSALFAGKVVTLHRWPMYRDSFFFLISVFIMLVALYDDLITWYEALVMCIFYGVYAVFMAYDASMEDFFVSKLKFLQDRVDLSEGMFPAQAQTEDTSIPVPTTIAAKSFDPSSTPGIKTPEKRVSISPYRKSVVELPPAVRVILEGQRRRMSLISLKRSSVVNEQIMANASIKDQVLAAVAASQDADSEVKSTLSPPKNHFLKILWVLYLPFDVVFYLTIPNCQMKERRKYFLITFIMSTLYITICSYVLVWMITIIGFTLDISDTVMGMTFLAIGVTLPDIVASLLVVRKGFGDMAVCNALGSNIFEILVGLGLPWLIKTLLIQPGIPVLVESRGMMYSTISLLLTLVFLIVLTHWNKWRMNKMYGAILMVWYIVFLTLSCLYELGYLGEPAVPMCPSSY